MGDEWNKGYFSYGPHHTYEAQQGAWARERDDLARAEKEKAAAQAEQQTSNRAAPSINTPTYSTGASYPTQPGEPATFWGTVKGIAIVGLLAMMAYAYFGLGQTSWIALALWAAKGIVAGAAAGVVLYLVIMVLRVVFAVLAVVVKAALWIGLIFGGLYLLSQMA